MKSDWGFTPEGYQPDRAATAEEFAVAMEFAGQRAAAAERAKVGAVRAGFDQWAAQLDARLGTAQNTPELDAARAALTKAESALSEVSKALHTQRAELVKLETAALAPLSEASLSELARTAKQVGQRAQELDAQRAIVAELERRHAAAVAVRDAAHATVGRLATARLAEYAGGIVDRVLGLWAPIWEAHEELQRVEQLIEERAGTGRIGARLNASSFVRMNDHLGNV